MEPQRPRRGCRRPLATAALRANAIAIALSAVLSAGFSAVSSAALPVESGAAAETAAKKPKALPFDDAAVATDLRDFRLTTDEVTWLSVDASPDGRELVIDVLGDLYTLPIAGGAATPLETGIAFDSQPTFSPDGAWIAFLSDRDGAENLWIRPRAADGADTAAKKLSADKDSDFASPAWSADGQYVVVSRAKKGQRTFELWMYHKDGGSGVQVTQAKPKPDTPNDRRHNAVGAVASPDGRFLYYAMRHGGFEYNADFPMWQVARRDLTTGDEDVITTAQGSAVRPRLSPDGRILVYATRRDNETGLKSRDLATGEERWLAYPVQRDEQESRYTRDLYPGYAFTSDGREIVVSWGGRLHRLEIATGRHREIPFRADVQQRLGPQLVSQGREDDGPVRARITQGAAPSPDGSEVAFSALTGITITNVASGQTRPLTAGAVHAFQPTWSPDGKSIAYVTWDKGGGRVFRQPVAGGPAVRLTATAAYYTQPTWSPDGTRIIVLRGSRQARLEMPAEFGRSPLPLDLVALDPSVADGEPQLIAPSRGLGRPHFGPEPDRLYVYSQDGLVSMKLDGTDRRTRLVVKGPGLYAAEEPVPASEVQISPDGDWALAEVGNRLFLIAAPRTGGAPEVNIDSAAVPAKKLTPLGADGFTWADGGRTIAWTLGATLFRTARESVVFDQPRTDAPADGDRESERPAETFPEAEASALTVELPRSRPSGVVALVGARLVTMRRDEVGAVDEVIDDGVVVVENDRIRAVGKAGATTIPAGARIIDVAGKTIVPGFVDTHAHWTEIRRGVLDTDGWMFLANLAWGVTTGLDVQTGSNDTFAYQDLIDAGLMIGPRAHSTGPGIFSDNDFRSREQALGVLRGYRDHYRTRNLKAYLSGNREQRQWLLQAARELAMMPTTEGALDLELDLTHAIDGFAGNEHALPVTPLYRDVVELFAQSGIGYTPTLLVAYGGPWAEDVFYTQTEVHDRMKLRRFVPHEVVDAKTRKRPWFRPGEHVYPRLAAEAAKIVRAGGRVGVGSHGQLQGLGYHWEMWALASGGLSPHEILRCATLLGAEIIGLGNDLGSLEAGKLADLVVLERNPLDDIGNTDSLAMVMKNGELFDAETLDQVWPVKKSLAPLWWWDTEPAKTTADSGAP